MFGLFCFSGLSLSSMRYDFDFSGFPCFLAFCPRATSGGRQGSEGAGCRGWVEGPGFEAGLGNFQTAHPHKPTPKKPTIQTQVHFTQGMGTNARPLPLSFAFWLSRRVRWAFIRRSQAACAVCVPRCTRQWHQAYAKSHALELAAPAVPSCICVRKRNGPMLLCWAGPCLFRARMAARRRLSLSLGSTQELQSRKNYKAAISIPVD